MRTYMFGIFTIVGVFGTACTLPTQPLPGATETAPAAVPGSSSTDPAPAAPAASGDSSSTSTTAAPSAGLSAGTTTTTTTTAGSDVGSTPPRPDETYVDDLVLDDCNDPTYAGQDYATVARDHFIYRFVAGSAAEKDLDSIALARESAYAASRDFLGLTDAEAPIITEMMSPNRLAAQAHGYGKGNATPASNRIDVIYLPEADSYEHQHPGHEITHVLSSKVDGAPTHLPFLDEGLSEYLDASHRDLHASYAAELKGGAEASSSVTRFVDSDVWGKNYGRSGSFVKFLVERHGKEKFLDLWRASAATWSGWNLLTKDGTLVTNGIQLENAMDHMLTAVYGVGFDAMRAEWETELAPYLAAPAAPLTAADVLEIRHVLRGVDWAINNKSSRAYRNTMEGFYCDSWTEETKVRIASTAVEGRGTVTTEMLSAHAVNMKNYPQAMVFVARHELHGATDAVTTAQIWLEHFPVGWRVTWATAW